MRAAATLLLLAGLGCSAWGQPRHYDLTVNFSTVPSGLEVYQYNYEAAHSGGDVYLGRSGTPWIWTVNDLGQDQHAGQGSDGALQ